MRTAGVWGGAGSWLGAEVRAERGGGVRCVTRRPRSAQPRASAASLVRLENRSSPTRQTVSGSE